MKNKTSIAGRSARGFAMFEALIALLICAMGILGVVGLQGSMTRAQTASTFRAEASFLAQQLIGEMWGDMNNLATYNTASCGARCKAWTDRVAARLPKGQATVVVTAPRNVSIQIRWTAPGEGTSNYSTVTAVGAP
ncbi:pilus assembly protein PilV [Kinneretia asaccharophila]|nr:pilus assembly protein PilV [Roseateles asaccharophilus]MDN3544069.1 pilus assembly protein PilV [Roseateles asaccharophilus]